MLLASRQEAREVRPAARLAGRLIAEIHADANAILARVVERAVDEVLAEEEHAAGAHRQRHRVVE